MSKAALLFNGIRFPFAVIDHSFEWAKNQKGDLLAIFLLSKGTEPEGYIFPSDIDQAENLADDDDSTGDNDKVVESNIEMLKHRAVGDGINFTSVVLHDPPEDTLSETLDDCDYLFATKDLTEVSVGTVDSRDLKKILRDFKGKIEMI